MLAGYSVHLQKENFYNPASDVDFDDVHKKYLPALERIRTRGELSDLIWDMQGDLKTSHAYEYYGDYVFKARTEFVGRLGATFSFDNKKKCFSVKKVFKGDAWNAKEYSPLESMNVALKEGDEIYRVDGSLFSDPMSIYRLLEKKSGEYVELEVLRKGKRKKEIVNVVTLDKKSRVTYRNWVNQNREYVHKKSKGKVGYVHIPSMNDQGYSEFYRNFIEEQSKDALIIDVRFNEGGNVSRLILQLLSQKLLGWETAKWSDQKMPYPTFSRASKLICLTNELTGSDGDIFSYAFKKLKLGKLVV